MKTLHAAFTTAAVLSLAACSGGGSTDTIVPAPASVGAPAAVTTPQPAASPTAAPAKPTPAPTPTPVPSPLTSADQQVTPVLTCVEYVPWSGRYSLRFGYTSTEATGVIIPIDSMDGTTQLNRIVVTPDDGSAPYEVQGQPALFAPGSVGDAIDVPVRQKDRVTWSLDGTAITKTTNGASNCP